MSKHIHLFHQFFRLNFIGLVTGFLFYCFALTPSLLPRPAFFEGFLAGLCFALGYGLGVLISWVLRRIIRKEPRPRAKKIAWRAGLGAMAIAGLCIAIQATNWQNDVRRLVGETELADQQVLTILIVAFLTASILVFMARLIYRVIYLFGETFDRWLPRRIGFAIGTALVVLLLVWFFNGVLFNAFVSMANNTYRSANQDTKPGAVQPESELRSGSKASLVAWDDLGRQGRSFVSDGPSKDDLVAFTKQEPTLPIRVYVGFDAAETIDARAALAVKELERTKAFEREILCVMTATGTGWIEPEAADSLEYLWNGDTALATIQYSYLPSWISFLVDRQNATDAGRALFNAVYEKWSELPEGDRPKLLVYGLSLGSFGAQAAFSGEEDLQNRTDGALFIGTPHGSDLWKFFTEKRDEGSPEWQPLYQNGKVVRFASEGIDLEKPKSEWDLPRIVYLQHASDPVVWWNPALIWHEPDWLKEERGPDVSTNMQWYPFATFFQVTVDQFFGTTVPVGHGHNYADSMVAAWSALAAPTDWNEDKTIRLQEHINTYSQEANSKTK